MARLVARTDIATVQLTTDLIALYNALGGGWDLDGTAAVAGVRTPGWRWRRATVGRGPTRESATDRLERYCGCGDNALHRVARSSKKY